MPRNETLLERRYKTLFSEYKAYFGDTVIGDITIEYLAKENKGGDQGEIHQEARKKAFNIEKLLDGELRGVEVKRNGDWNLFLAKTG